VRNRGPLDAMLPLNLPSYAEMANVLLVPVALLPEPSVQELSPEQRLILATLIESVRDAEGRSSIDLKHRARVMAEAQRWWLDEFSDALGSARWCCDVLGIPFQPLVARLSARWKHPMEGLGPVRRRQRTREDNHLALLPVSLRTDTRALFSWSQVVRRNYFAERAA
jgi:hypothetical protein